MLSTIYLFKNQQSSTTTDDCNISAAIEIATSFIEKYLDRNLEKQSYKTWQNGTNTNIIQLHEWPINRIFAIESSIQELIRIKTHDDTSLVSNINIELGDEQCTYWYTGSDDEVVVDGYTTMQELIDKLNAEVDTNDDFIFDASLISDDYSTIPTSFIRPLTIQTLKNQYNTISGIYNPTTSKYTIESFSNRIIHTDFCMPSGINNIFVWYSAGYTYPIDNDFHTGLTTEGNVPTDLISIVNTLANDLLSNVFTNGAEVGNVITSESQGKYSYSKQNLDTTILPYLTDQVLKYETILSKYKRLVL